MRVTQYVLQGLLAYSSLTLYWAFYILQITVVITILAMCSFDYIVIIFQHNIAASVCFTCITVLQLSKETRETDKHVLPFEFSLPGYPSITCLVCSNPPCFQQPCLCTEQDCQTLSLSISLFFSTSPPPSLSVHLSISLHLPLPHLR